MKRDFAPALFPTLAAYIEQTGDTQERIANRTGTTQATIARIAAGNTAPRPRLAARLAEYARVPLDSFTRVYLEKQAQPRPRRKRGSTNGKNGKH